MTVKCEICGKILKDTRGLAGHKQFKHSDETAPGEKTTSTVTVGRSSPGSLDTAMEKVKMPPVPWEFNSQAAIYWSGFNEGLIYGVNSIMAGIRAAQELSSLGITQATPIIKMAKGMRKAEGQAAQEAANSLAQLTMQSNQQIMAAIHDVAASQGKEQPPATNPMMDLMSGAMKPHLENVINQVFTSMFQGIPPQTVGQQQQQSETWQPPNITRRSIDEYEENFRVKI